MARYQLIIIIIIIIIIIMQQLEKAVQYNNHNSKMSYNTQWSLFTACSNIKF